MVSAMSCELDGPSGLNQVTVQFKAPSIARVMTAASTSANSPALMPELTSRLIAIS